MKNELSINSVYMSLAYQSRTGNWGPNLDDGDEFPAFRSPALFWAKDLRKPSSGMLLRAMSDFRTTPAQTIFVGDADGTNGRDEDMHAAEAAGIDFISAREFFNWSE